MQFSVHGYNGLWNVILIVHLWGYLWLMSLRNTSIHPTFCTFFHMAYTDLKYMI